MTQEEKRIKIAEMCGWKIGPPLISPSGELINAHYSESWRLPDYFSDLNACHEMEKVFGDNKDLWKKYSDCLMRLTQDERIDIFYSDAVSARYRSSGASAFKRAEAFGKTMKLW